LETQKQPILLFLNYQQQLVANNQKFIVGRSSSSPIAVYVTTNHLTIQYVAQN